MSDFLNRLTVAAAAVALSATSLVGSAAADVGRGPEPALRAAAGTSGSIVYVKTHNVWIARGDGSHRRRLTRNGTASRPYRSPSEADGGTIAAAHGTEIVRMSHTGKVLATLDPPALRDSAGGSMDGTVNEVALSPDGRRIAFGYVRYSCPIGGDCLVRYATGYTFAASRRSAGRSTYFHHASWVSSRRTLQSGGYGSQVMVHDLTSAPVHWFDDSDYAGDDTDLSDGELSPDGAWLAEIRGYGGSSTVAWYHVHGNVRSGRTPGYPDIACLTGGEPRHASPTWSPDSTAVAFAARQGIVIQRSATAGDCHGSTPPRVAIPGGTSPDWSPAS